MADASTSRNITDRSPNVQAKQKDSPNIVALLRKPQQKQRLLIPKLPNGQGQILFLQAQPQTLIVQRKVTLIQQQRLNILRVVQGPKDQQDSGVALVQEAPSPSTNQAQSLDASANQNPTLISLLQQPAASEAFATLTEVDMCNDPLSWRHQMFHAEYPECLVFDPKCQWC